MSKFDIATDETIEPEATQPPASGDAPAPGSQSPLEPWARIQRIAADQFVIYTDLDMSDSSYIGFNDTLRKIPGIAQAHVSAANYGPCAVFIRHAPVYTMDELMPSILRYIRHGRIRAGLQAADVDYGAAVPMRSGSRSAIADTTILGAALAIIFYLSINTGHLSTGSIALRLGVIAVCLICNLRLFMRTQ